MTVRNASLVLVANWDSDAGYAWWLMESYWCALAQVYAKHGPVYIAYPSISKIPAAVQQAPATCVGLDFTRVDWTSLTRQIGFIKTNHVRTLYFSDQPFWHWKYLIYRWFGVGCIVVHDHTPGMRPAARGLKRFLKRIVFRVPWISANAVFGATPFVTRRAIDVACAPESMCYTVPNGLPPLTSESTADVHSRFGIPVGRRILVSVSRATFYKGIQFVLNCLAVLVNKQECKNLHFLYCGDGPDLDRFKQLANNLGIADHVTFAGRRSDVSELLGGCHFAIQPSQGEVGYSLSILEYMRAGLPVIVPDNPSVCLATTDGVNGLIYKEGDQVSAIEAIHKLFSSPALAVSLGKNAKHSVQNTFSLQLAHQELIKAIKAVDPLFGCEQQGGFK